MFSCIDNHHKYAIQIRVSHLQTQELIQVEVQAGLIVQFGLISVHDIPEKETL